MKYDHPQCKQHETKTAHKQLNHLPLKCDFLRILKTLKNHELFKEFHWPIKIRMDLLHARYTDE